MYRNLMISAINSHSGKTVITSSLIAALVKRGLKTATFKTGPDYIDPMYHSILSGRACINLEPYFLEPGFKKGELKRQFYKYSEAADISIIEAAMGYFSGIYKEEPRGSAYIVADELKSYVIMIVGKDNYMQLKDYLDSYHDIYVKAVIINRVNEEEYLSIKPYIEDNLSLKVLGYVREDERFSIESRHLGLHTPDNISDILSIYEERAALLAETLDIELLLNELETCSEDTFMEYEKADSRKAGERVKIAFAKDEAFSFIYHDNLELLKELGAKIIYFSPIHDKELPGDIDGLWIVGGYPERYLKELEENVSMRVSIKEAINLGLPTVAECGGFMYLQESLKGKDEKSYKMVGAIEGESFPTDKLQRFGYIEVTADEDNMLLKKGESFRAHEFHYWDSTHNGDTHTAVKANKSKEWKCIQSKGNLFAGYPHIYLRGCEVMAERFIKSCAEYRKNIMT